VRPPEYRQALVSESGVTDVASVEDIELRLGGTRCVFDGDDRVRRGGYRRSSEKCLEELVKWLDGCCRKMMMKVMSWWCLYNRVA
jgi:hypothetical protein